MSLDTAASLIVAAKGPLTSVINPFAVRTTKGFFMPTVQINIIPRFCTLNTIVICEGTSSIITCPDKSLIQIHSAFYGRFNNKLCPSIATEMNPCSSANVTDFFQKLCYKNNSCFIVSNNYVFGYDPCLATLKYTIVNYNCYLENSLLVPQILNKFTNISLNNIYDEFVLSFALLFIQNVISNISTEDKVSNVLIIDSLVKVSIANINLLDKYTYSINATANTWYSIEISQYFNNEHNNYILTIAVNGTVQNSYINTQPMLFTDVSLYTFVDCLYTSCYNGFIKNLSIYSKTQVFWSQWSEWSLCNETFFITRNRYCNNNQWLNCTGNDSEIQSCTNQVFWSQWSEWSLCNETFFITRNRYCNNNQWLNCTGNDSEIQSCTNQVFWSQWSEWSQCNETFFITRNRYCNNNKWLNCTGNDSEVQSCANQEIWSQWSEWSQCNSTFFISRTRNCITNQWLNCTGNSNDVKSCQSNIGVVIHINENQLQTEPCKTTVVMRNCTNVKLLLDFGDETTVTNIKNINPSTLKDCTYSEIHRYSLCQQYTITAYVFDNDGNITSPLFTNSTNVRVFCNLSLLSVITTPPISLNGYVQLSLNKSITLDIFQETGSNMLYSIDWGDGNFSVNNQTLNLSPVSFQVQHIYKNINNYTISIACKNNIQTLSSIFFPIIVANCCVPNVSFYYGTIYNPMTIIKSAGRDLTAFVENVGSFCNNISLTFEWNLTSLDLKLIVAKKEGVLYHQKVTYSILKNSLDFGTYILSLQCNYGGISAVYTAYLNVIFSPLYIDIDKGLFVSVAYKKKIGMESFYQNFKVSAMSSYDPDDPTVGTQNIVFRWSCKVASIFSDAQVAMENVALLNLTFPNDTCFNESWTDISSAFSEIIFSTRQFLKEISYHIKVCGTKYAGKDVYSNDCYKTSCFVQEVLISESLPTVAIKCISNCDTLLNFKERLIYTFNCEDCGSRRLVAHWTIEDENKNFPPELSVQNATSTGFLKPSLVINRDILLELKQYTFTLVFGYANSVNRAKLKFKKSTCSKPTPGYCIINPDKGFALETKFILYCYGWRDTYGLLSYAFYNDNGQSQQIKLSSVTSVDHPFLNAGTTDQPSLINFLLGPGDKNNDYKIRILIKVIGKYKAYAEYNLYIKVYPNNKPMNLKALLTDISLNDTQSIANLVQAVSNNIIKNSENQYDITSSFSNELLDVVDEDTLKQIKQQEFFGLQELRIQLIDLISNTLLIDLNSFKLLSDALVVTTQNPLEIVPHAQNKAASLVDKLARLLTKKSLKDFGADLFETMSQSFVNLISNLLQPGFPTPSLNHGQANIQAEQIVSVLIKSMENYFIAAQTYKVPGENITEGETKQFDFVLKKDVFIDLNSSFIGSPDGGFYFPDSKYLFNESLQNSQISIHVSYLAKLVNFYLVFCKFLFYIFNDFSMMLRQ
ncbi:uncharacterized protein LOC136080277 [Hydra vulgaris]|uniref:Uncharacterized protein LOC136080277 n=1 Tax=Hydra vulgaris TaxID=6087 RepID=A0ABM4BUV5_HYDVU